MIIDLLRNRFSARRFMDKQIPKDIVDLIIEAGSLSSSGGNEQAWKFGVITDKGLICNISEIGYN